MQHYGRLQLPEYLLHTQFGRVATLLMQELPDQVPPWVSESLIYTPVTETATAGPNTNKQENAENTQSESLDLDEELYKVLGEVNSDVLAGEFPKGRQEKSHPTVAGQDQNDVSIKQPRQPKTDASTPGEILGVQDQIPVQKRSIANIGRQSHLGCPIDSCESPLQYEQRIVIRRIEHWLRRNADAAIDSNLDEILYSLRRPQDIDVVKIHTESADDIIMDVQSNRSSVADQQIIPLIEPDVRFADDVSFDLGAEEAASQRSVTLEAEARRINELLPKVPLPFEWIPASRPNHRDPGAQLAIPVLKRGPDSDILVLPEPGYIAHWTKARCHVCTNYPVTSICGIYYYEVHIFSKPSHELTIGFSEIETSGADHPAVSHASQCYLSLSKKSIFGPRSHVAVPFTVEDWSNLTLGCGVNFTARTMFFTVNGNRLGKELEEIFPAREMQDFRPCIGFQEQIKLRPNLGKDKFQYDINSYVLDNIGRISLTSSFSSREVSKRPELLNASKIQENAREICYDYLRKRGYSKAARAFESHCKESGVPLCGKKTIDPILPIDHPSSYRNRALIKVSELISKGEPLTAVIVFQTSLANCYNCLSSSLQFSLLSRCYVELIVRKGPLKLLIAIGKVLTSLSSSSSTPEYRKSTETLLALLVVPVDDLAVRLPWLLGPTADKRLAARIDRYMTLNGDVESTELESMILRIQMGMTELAFVGDRLSLLDLRPLELD